MIALRGTLNNFTVNNNNGNDVTLTLDTITPPLVDDIIVVFGGHAATDTTLAAPIGNTSGNFQQLGIHTGTAPIFGAWWQRAGATPDTSVLCDGGGNAADGVQYGVWVISGVDPVTALDVAATTAGPTTSTNPNAPSITPPTDNAWVFAMAGSEVRDTSPGTVSGYTNQMSDTRNETADQTIAGATFNITTNGGSAEDPAAWDTWLSGAWYAITAAFRPEVAVTTMDAAVGSYLLTGLAAGTGVSTVAAVGTYLLTGIDAGTGVSTVAGVGTYALTGIDAGTGVSTVASLGTYILTGVDAGTGVSTVASVGSYILTGAVAGLDITAIVMTADADSYILTGIDATTTAPGGGRRRFVTIT